MSSAVRQLTGQAQETPVVDGISAETLNSHYASIYTDPDYSAPRCKFSAKFAEQKYFSMWQVFRVLDHLGPTATGLDTLPAWFLELGTPALFKPIIRLYELPIATSTVPHQSKIACIKLLPMIAKPK